MSGSRFLFLDANPAWLDFVNTELVEDGHPVDLLERFEDLADWLRETRLLGSSPGAFRSWGGTAAARDALARAKEFRRTLREAAEALRKGGVFPPRALQEINRLLGLASGRYRLSADKAGFHLAFESTPRKPLQLLEPLARSAAEFLTRADLGRVRRCGNPHCVLFFYDGTKNGGRRWCSMALCGNRMKVAAFYRRRKKDRAQ